MSGAEDAYERLFELAAVLGELMDQGLSGRGLTRARAELLWRLHHQGAMTQRELSEALRCTPRNVTGLLDALETAGLIARRPHPADRRASLVGLTDQGQRTLGTLHDEYRSSAHEVFDGLPPGDLRTFVAIVDHLIARLRSTQTRPERA